MEAPPATAAAATAHALAATLNFKNPPLFLKSGKDLFEPVNGAIRRRLDNLLDDTLDDITEDDTTIRYRQLASEYRDNIKPTFQAVQVRYTRHKNNVGRSDVSKKITGNYQPSWTHMDRALRNTLLADQVYDIDLQNAQPSILLQVCLNSGYQVPLFQAMCDNRDEFIDTVKQLYGVDRSAAKELVNSLIFGGSLSKWKYSHQVGGEDNPAFTKRCDDIVTEIERVTDKLKKANTENHLTKIISDMKEAKKEKEKKGTFLSFYLGHCEFAVVDYAMNWVANRGGFDYQCGKKRIHVGSYEFDGFKLWREAIDNIQPRVSIDSFMGELNEAIQTVFGPCIRFVNKELGDLITNMDLNKRRLDEDKPRPSKKGTSNDYLFTEEYKAWKEKFEEEGWCKIENLGVYVCEEKDADGSFRGMLEKTRKDLNESKNHYKYNVMHPIFGLKTINLIETWTNFDPDIKVYIRLDSIPYDRECPANVKNLWQPYPMEEIPKEGYTKNEEYHAFWINHIHILCGRDHPVTEYVLDWMGHMFSHPSEKPGVTIDFISGEGAGKNTLFELIKRMIGSKKCLDTTKPQDDVWGTYNPLMRDCMLVLLNELSKSSLAQAEGELKSLVTDPTCQIREKYHSTIVLPSYHRFMSFQNNDTGDAGKRVKTGDRRTLIIRCSDELAAKQYEHIDPQRYAEVTEYWNDVYTKKLTDINGIKSFYEYLKSRPGVDKFRSLQMPVSQYQENLMQANLPPMVQFIIDYATEHHEAHEPITVGNKIMFELWKRWKSNTQTVWEVSSNSFSQRINNLRIPGVTRGNTTNSGRPYVLDIQQILDHYKVGQIENDITTDTTTAD